MTTIQDVLYDNFGKHNLEKLDESGLTSAVKQSMKEYARQKCKKQRELCVNNGIRDYDDSKSINFIIDDTIDKIFSAPEPELD